MNLLHEIIASPWFIDKQYADDHFHLVVRMLRGELFNPVASQQSKSEEMKGQASLAILNNKKPFTADAFDIYYNADQIIEPSVFILNVAGPITKYPMMCGPTGMAAKAEWIQKADMHPNIFAHAIKIDSGGGSGYAARFMGEVLSNLEKPVFAFIDDYGASAAYWIASAAQHIAIGSKMGMAGSIGTYLTLRDYTEALKMEGIKEVDVYAEKSKEKNEVYRLMQDGKIEEAIQRAQLLANQFNDFFLAQVKQSRKGKLKSNDWNTGKFFFAEEALEIGLVDDIMPWDQFLQNIFDEFAP
ncbi:MAG: S49 family peptidase [Bacteroidales bacterium]|nr:S49 family peptidase [Bacteroidales bacterium]